MSVGPFYGEFVTIRDSTYAEMKEKDRGALKKGSIIKEYIYSKESNTIDVYRDGEYSKTEYYSERKVLDSVVSYSSVSDEYKYIFYSSPFKDFHVKYVIRNDTVVNSSQLEFDQEGRTCTDYDNEEVYSKSYYDREGKLKEKSSSKGDWKITYRYDNHGNLVYENSDGRVITHKYEYDEHNNWTKHTLYHTLSATGIPVQMITERTITYPDSSLRNKLMI